MWRKCSVLVVFGWMVLVSGCSHGADVVPITATPAPSTSDSSAVDNPPGANTCALLGAAIKRSTLMEAGVVDGINRASSTADAPVADAAARLATVYAVAVAAHGKADEPDRVAAVSAAASDLSGVCTDSGLATDG